MTAKAALTELSYAQSSLSIDLRADGRARLDYRPFQVSTGVTPQANGSALVKAAGGATQILAGIKLEVCSGADLSAGESQIVFSVEWFVGLCLQCAPTFSLSLFSGLSCCAHVCFDGMLCR